MPITTQALYFHFGMRADDDGFVSSPKKILKIANCTNDDLRLLVAKGYIIPFETGVVVITDWKKNNFIRSDRHKPTQYQEEMKRLSISGGSYMLNTVGIPNDNQVTYQRETQVSIDNGAKAVASSTVSFSIDSVLKRLRQQGIEIERFTHHAFRDTFATRYIEEGGNMQTLQKILGHSSLAMTADLYAHVLPSTKQQEMKQIENGFSEVAVL